MAPRHTLKMSNPVTDQVRLCDVNDFRIMAVVELESEVFITETASSKAANRLAGFACLQSRMKVVAVAATMKSCQRACSSDLLSAARLEGTTFRACSVGNRNFEIRSNICCLSWRKRLRKFRGSRVSITARPEPHIKFMFEQDRNHDQSINDQKNSVSSFAACLQRVCKPDDPIIE